MPRHTHPGRARARRSLVRLKARQAKAPAGPSRKARPRPVRCHECWRTEHVEEYEATPIVGARRRDETATILLCRICLLERSASWRWRVKITGRALPEQEDRAA